MYKIPKYLGLKLFQTNRKTVEINHYALIAIVLLQGFLSNTYNLFITIHFQVTLYFQ